MEGLPGHPLRRPRRRAGGGATGAERDLSADATPARRLVLLRHGRTAHNAAGVIQGHLDTPLDDLGLAQAEVAAPLVAAGGVGTLLSSDLSRARTTADAVSRASGRPVTVDARLRELHLGLWQGLSVSEAAERYPDEHSAWRDGRDVRRGGGETAREAGERAVACLREHLPAVPPGETLVAVTHGGTARAVLGLLLELPDDAWARLTALGNCRWSVLVEHPRGWRLAQHGAGEGLAPALAERPTEAGRSSL